MGVRVVIGGAACAILVAACGSASPHNRVASSPYGPKSSPAAMSRCMRANGLSHFPDPRSSPNGGGVGFPGGFLITGPNSISVMGIPFSGPAVTRAEKACAEYMPPPGGPPPISASQKKQEIEEAECMRKHGVPNFPDPTFSGGGQAPIPNGLNPNSPSFRHAATVCGAGGGLRFEAG